MTRGRRVQLPTRQAADTSARLGRAGHVPPFHPFNLLPAALLKVSVSTLTDPLC